MLSTSIFGRRVASFEELVANLPADAVASPRRSTVPLIDYWREPLVRLENLWGEIRYRPLGLPEIHFEYSVPVQSGRGKPSYTDLMILAESIAVAIEAKFTEPTYETVSSWLGSSPTRNRRAVLDGWLSIIGRVIGRPMDAGAVMDLPYQLIHRTASVCFVERPNRYVVYQVFGDAPPPHYAEQLGRFAMILAAGDRIRFIILGCAFQRSEVYRELEMRWDSGQRDLGSQVRGALLAGSLLQFRKPITLQIRPAP